MSATYTLNDTSYKTNEKHLFSFLKRREAKQKKTTYQRTLVKNEDDTTKLERSLWMRKSSNLEKEMNQKLKWKIIRKF